MYKLCYQNNKNATAKNDSSGHKKMFLNRFETMVILRKK